MGKEYKLSREDSCQKSKEMISLHQLNGWKFLSAALHAIRECVGGTSVDAILHAGTTARGTGAGSRSCDRVAPSWLWSLNHPAGDLEVLYCVDGAAQISAATISWDPTHPLRRVEHSSLGLHDSSLAIAPIGVASDVDVYVGAIRTVL